MFALLDVMHRMDDKRALNHSVSVIDCLETWKLYEKRRIKNLLQEFNFTYFGRGLSHRWKTVVPAFDAEHDQQRRQLGMNQGGKWRERGHTGTQVGLLLPTASVMRVTYRTS